MWWLTCFGPRAIDTRLLSARNKEVVWSASTRAFFFFNLRRLDDMQCDGQIQNNIRRAQQISPIPVRKRNREQTSHPSTGWSILKKSNLFYFWGEDDSSINSKRSSHRERYRRHTLIIKATLSTKTITRTYIQRLQIRFFFYKIGPSRDKFSAVRPKRNT